MRLSALGGAVLFVLIGWISKATAHSFVTTTVDANVEVGESSTGIAFASNGDIGVCYHDATNDHLRFAYFDGDNWATELVDADNNSGDDVGKHCAMAFDADDVPHLLYFNATDGDVRHARKPAGQGWIVATVDDNVGLALFANSRITLAQDRNGEMAIAYYDATASALRMATYRNGAWAVEEVINDGDVGQYPSLAYDRNNRAGISYMKYINDASSHLMLIEHNGAAWQAPVTVRSDDRSGSSTGLAYDSANVAHLVYRYRDAQGYYSAKYTRRDNGQWAAPMTLQFGSALETGGFCQIAIGPSDNIHMIYRYYFRSALFGQANYLRMDSIYFPEDGIDEAVMQPGDNLAFSVAPALDISALSLAVDEQQRMAVAYVPRAWFGGSTLVVKRLDGWRPAVSLLTPNDAERVPANDRFTVRWKSFDPDSNADLRFYAVDAQWQQTAFAETAREDDANVQLSTAELAKGSYNIEGRISDDNFQMWGTHWGPSTLSIPNRAPTVPNLMGPANGAEVADRTPSLQFGNAGDVDGDPRTYDVQIATDQLFANLVVNQSGIAEAAGLSTSWDVAAELPDDILHYWRVRARDNDNGIGGWSATRTFVVRVNDPPATPVAVAHQLTEHDGEVVWQNVADPEGDAIIYAVQVCSDANCQQVVHSAANIVAGNNGTSRLRVVSAVAAGAYSWRVRAFDASGAASAWSATAALQIAGEAAAPQGANGNGGAAAAQQQPAGGQAPGVGGVRQAVQGAGDASSGNAGSADAGSADSGSADSGQQQSGGASSASGDAGSSATGSDQGSGAPAGQAGAADGTGGAGSSGSIGVKGGCSLIL